MAKKATLILYISLCIALLLSKALADKNVVANDDSTASLKTDVQAAQQDAMSGIQTDWFWGFPHPFVPPYPFAHPPLPAGFPKIQWPFVHPPLPAGFPKIQWPFVHPPLPAGFPKIQWPFVHPPLPAGFPKIQWPFVHPPLPSGGSKFPPQLPWSPWFHPWIPHASVEGVNMNSGGVANVMDGTSTKATSP